MGHRFPNCVDMLKHRLVYCPIFLTALGLWLGYGTPFSFRWLLAVAGLPWLSLLLSLPAMVTFRVCPSGESRLRMGQSGTLLLQGTTPLPMPPFRGRLRLYPGAGGKRFWYDPVAGIPTDHCAGFRVQVERGRVYDYLGLFCLPVLHKDSFSLVVLPQGRTAPMPDLENPPVQFWKSGIGVPPSEQYELRQFHWGDELKSLHWKLSLKTGKALIRQTQIPVTPVLTLDLISGGSSAALDEKYGKLLWLGETLLAKNVPFQIRALTGTGISVTEIGDSTALEEEISRLLLLPPASVGESPPKNVGLWLWSIEEELPCKSPGLA